MYAKEVALGLPKRALCWMSSAAWLRRRKSQGIIEIDLGGAASGSMATLMETRYVAFSMLWSADDPIPTGARVWLATGYRTCAEAFRRWHSRCRRCCARTRSAVICSCSAVAEATCEGDLARWPGRMPVYQKIRQSKVHLPSVAGEAVTISPAQMNYLLSGIDWRNPQETLRSDSRFTV